MFEKFLVIVLYERFYHVATIYTRTVPAWSPDGTESVLRTLAIFQVLFPPPARPELQDIDLWCPMNSQQKTKKHLISQVLFTPPTGLEPVTPWLTVRCSTDWAMEECMRVQFLQISTHLRRMLKNIFFGKDSSKVYPTEPTRGLFQICSNFTLKRTRG